MVDAYISRLKSNVLYIKIANNSTKNTISNENSTHIHIDVETRFTRNFVFFYGRIFNRKLAKSPFSTFILVILKKKPFWHSFFSILWYIIQRKQNKRERGTKPTNKCLPQFKMATLCLSLPRNAYPLHPLLSRPGFRLLCTMYL